jgi:hypothetical protein
MMESPMQISAPPTRDWLLTSARWLIGLLLVVTAVVSVVLAGLAVAVPFNQARVAARIARHTGQVAGEGTTALIVLFLALAAVMCALFFAWLRDLRRVIDSVGEGNPFAPVNAQRLTRMGWITVAVELISIKAGGLAAYLTHHFRREHIDIGLSLGGVLLALVLFILARVFREGAKMREELEGTV